jgi:transcriptional regulator with XRE-family HTH domain
MEQQHMTHEQSRFIERLENCKYRESYIRASITVNLPSQIRALRLGIPMTQKEFATASEMKQPRISAMEKPGATRFNIETLIRVAATCGVGLIVKFVPISEMIAWENSFSQDKFKVAAFQKDPGLKPAAAMSGGSIAYIGASDRMFNSHPEPTRVWPRTADVVSTVNRSLPTENLSTSTPATFQL